MTNQPPRIAGAIGTLHGVRSALIAGTVLLLLPVFVLALSPVRSLRALPATTPSPDGQAPVVTGGPSGASPSALWQKEGDRP
ncbi:hypothetical protein [Streptomyces dysideae]|uniref:hypothetical protein n=1 Tax=Streptomyces dysideae TaxID=909626 RepID=UPI000AC077CB|nr:hypothetical protein [Streptomyces dysideae]